MIDLFIHLYVMQFISDLRHFYGFLFPPPPIKVTNNTELLLSGDKTITSNPDSTCPLFYSRKGYECK